MWICWKDTPVEMTIADKGALVYARKADLAQGWVKVDKDKPGFLCERQIYLVDSDSWEDFYSW